MLTIALGMFFAAAFLFPAKQAYVEWKKSRTEVTARKNWRGVYVPDLAIKRAERAGALAFVMLFLIGFGLMMLIMVD